MSAVKKLLTNLFEFQRFCRNPALQSVIDEVNAAYPDEEVDGDALYWIAAAGNPDALSDDLEAKDWDTWP